MNRIKKHIGPIITFILSIIITLIIFKLVGVFDNTIFISDLNAEYRPLLMKLQNGFSSYYYNTGLGDEFLGTFYYYMSSPLNVLALFIKDINILVITLVTLKLSLASVFAYHFFKYQFKEEKIHLLIAFSLLYTLSSFSLSYYLHIMWLDIYMLFPLVLLGIDKIINEKKHLLYIISLFLAIICNYYFAYMICIFSFIYFNYKVIIKYNSFKDILKKNIHFIIVSILTCLISLVAILPVASEISNYSRANSKLFGGLPLGFITDIKKLFNTIIMGRVEDIRLLNDNDFYLFSTILTIPMLYFYYINKNITKKEKILTSIIFIILVISVTCNYVNIFWHGLVLPSFFNGRFTFMFILFTLYIILKSLYEMKDYHFIHYIISFIIFLVPFILLGTKDLTGYLKLSTLIVYLILIKLSFKLNTKYIFLGLVIYEIILCGSLYLDRYTFDSDDTNSPYEKCIDYIKDVDDSKYYRIENNLDNTNNLPMLHDYYGVDYFMSTLKKDNINFFVNLDLGNHEYTKNTISYDGSYFMTSSLLGVKYYIDENIRENKYYDKPIYRISSLYTVYKNKYALNFGYMVNNDITSVKLDSNGLENLNRIYKSMTDNDVLTRADVKKINDYNYEIKNKNKDFYVLVKFKNWYSYSDLNIYINNVRQNKTMGTYNYFINNNYDSKNIDLRLELNDYNLKDIEGVYVYYIDMDKFEDSINKLKKNQLIVHNINKETLAGEINVDKSGILYTSIPYNKDLHIYVDGKEVNSIKLLDNFLGTELKKGKHNIKIKYIPKVLYISFIPSIISSILLFIYLKLYKKRSS